MVNDYIDYMLWNVITVEQYFSSVIIFIAFTYSIIELRFSFFFF